jgi:hypothetical protein
MNWPQQPQQQQWPQQPQQPAYQPPVGPPQQQPWQPQQQPNLTAAAGGNLFNQFLSEPPRQKANRAKPHDGTYVVRFTPGCQIKYSQQDNRPFLLLEYQVIEGTVPQMGGQVFGLPVFWSNRPGLQDLADLAKYTFGANLQQVAAQTGGDPQRMAQAICQVVMQGMFAGVRVSRNPKNVAQVGYEQAFANHQWITISQQPMTLAQLGPALGPPSAPSMPSMQPMQQFPQPPQQQQPAWQPQQPAPQTMMPQPQQPAFQPPPQQAFGLPQGQPPQGGMLPQAPMAPPPSQQPTPAFFVPGTPPPR